MKNAPDKEEMENFWREIYEKEVQRNGESHWIENQYQQNSSMEWSPVGEKDVAGALRTTLNWKATGRDQIANFWLKQPTVTQRRIAALFNKLIEADSLPEWLTAGVKFLIPKNENSENPKNYRPVTSLPTIYKLMASIISRHMQKYMGDENLMPKEQKWCCSGSKGCKDQLLISKAILQECKRRNKNSCMA